MSVRLISSQEETKRKKGRGGNGGGGEGVKEVTEGGNGKGAVCLSSMISFQVIFCCCLFVILY